MGYAFFFYLLLLGTERKKVQYVYPGAYIYAIYTDRYILYIILQYRRIGPLRPTI